MDIEKTVAAIAAAEAEAADVPVAITAHDAVSRLFADGRINAAAHLALALRQHRAHVTVPEGLEPAIKRAQAERGAETFRAINRANHTNEKLPSWISAELGEDTNG